MTYRYFQKTLGNLGLTQQEQEELQYLICLIPKEEDREKIISQLTQDPNLLAEVTTFIKRKFQFIGEINEPGWDKVRNEQKKLLAKLTQ